MRKRPALWIGLAVAGLVLPVYLATLAPGLTWANQGADGGDLITAAATGGVAHPSGYPTYLILARLWQALPVGALALRTNLFSAVAAALAAGMVAPLVIQTYAGPRRWGLIGGAAAGLAFGLAPLLWSQAVITEVHALHALFVALLLWALPLGGEPSPRPGAHGAAGLGAGLALGNHLTTALLLPVWLGLAAWQGQQGRQGRWRLVGWRLAGLGLGLLVYAYLPLAASTRPPVNWGDARTLDGLWWVVSGAPYRDLAFGLDPEFLGGRVVGWAALFMAQFGWVGMVMALAGLFFGRVRGAAPRAMLLWMTGAGSLFAIGYNAADSQAYLLPVFLGAAVWLGVGVATGLDALDHWPRAKLMQSALLGGMGLALAANAVQTWPRVDARQDDLAETFGRAVMAAAPAGAVLITQGDQDTFALWYYRFALGQRPDVTVVVEPLLTFEWYRDSLEATFPTLPTFDSGIGNWRESLRSRGWTICEVRVAREEVLGCNGPSE